MHFGKSTVVRDVAMLTDVFFRSSLLHTPGVLLLRFLAGMILGVVLGLLSFFYGNSFDGHLAGFMLVGIALMMFTWGGERLLYAIVGDMFEQVPAAFAYLLRSPWWWLAGGVAYSVASLVAKKIGWLVVYDLPVRPIFEIGGKLGILLQFMNQIMAYLSVPKRGGGRVSVTHDGVSR